MAEQLHDVSRIESRLSAVRAVAGVVRAIWALSQAQLAQVESFSLHASIYLDWVDELVTRLAGPPVEPAAQQTLHVVLGPERPFCANLPAEVVRALPSDGVIGVCGRRLREAVADVPAHAARVVFETEGPTSVDDLDRIVERLAQLALEHGRDRRVVIAYPQTGASGLRTVTLLSGPRSPNSVRPFDTYSPIERLLERAIAESVSGRLRVALAQALRTEVRTRATAAENARHGVERQERALTSTLRILSQEQITNELAELFAGQL